MRNMITDQYHNLWYHLLEEVGAQCLYFVGTLVVLVLFQVNQMESLELNFTLRETNLIST